MNWSKAKTLFIIAFIIINIFLALQYFGSYGIIIRNTGISEEKNFEEEVKKELLKKNISINVDIPKKRQSMPLLEVEYDNIVEENNIVEKFLGKEYDEIVSGIYFENLKKESVEVKNSKKIMLTLRESDNLRVINEDEVMLLINEFSEKYNIDINNYIIDTVKEVNSYWVVEYKQKYKNTTLENSYIKMNIDADGVFYSEMQIIKNVIPNEGTILVTPALNSLLRLITDSSIYNDTINSIVLCYYKEENEMSSELIKDSILPAWKIVFESGEIRYLEERD